MNEKTIYSKKLAFWLREKGFKLLKVGVNPNFPQYNTYIFADSPSLSEAIKDFTDK